jgi:hypothetical protein
MKFSSKKMETKKWERNAVSSLSKILINSKEKIGKNEGGISFETGKIGHDYTRNKIIVNFSRDYILVEIRDYNDTKTYEEYLPEDLAEFIIKEKLKNKSEIKKFNEELKRVTGKGIEKYCPN